MKTTVLLLLASALLALGWLFFWPSEVEGLAPAIDTTPRSQAPAATEAVDIPRETATPTSPSPERSALEGDDAFLIRLVNGDTGEVIPNQELWYAPTTWNAGYDQESSVKSRGNKVQSNPDGIARIVEAPNQIILYARKDYLVGSRWLDRKSYRESGDDFATLELFPERVITLRVIDSTGIPAPGVWMKATPITEDGQDSRWGLAAATNQAGQIVWKDFESTLRTAQREDGDQITGLRVEALVPGHDPVSLNISPLPSHGQNIELQIPPTGSLTVRLLDPNRELVQGKHIIELRPLARNEETGKWDRGEPHGLTLEKGVGTIAKIALGGYFELSVQGIWRPKHRAEIFGPTNKDPAVTRDIYIEDTRIIWRGRAVDGLGNGLGGVRLKCEVRAGKKWMSYFADTDPEGRFMSILPEEYANRELTKAEIELTHHAIINLLGKSPFQTGVTDLGDIVFADQIALLSGTVVVPFSANCTSYRFRVYQRLPGTERWREVNTKTETEGTEFKIMGSLGAGDYQLRIISYKRCYAQTKPIPFVPGQEGITIELEPGHRLTVSAQMPAPAEAMSAVPLTFAMRPVSGPAYERLSARDRLGILGHWSREGTETLLEIDWQSLLPGIYELEVRFADVQPALLTVPAIQVPPSEDQNIHLDLTTELQEFHLTLNTPDGVAPTGWSNASLVREGEKFVRAIANCKPGENDIRVIVPPMVYDVWILASGYRPVHLRRLDRDQNVVLVSSRIDLAFHLRDIVTLPDGVGLMVHSESLVSVLPTFQRPSTGALATNVLWHFFSANGNWNNNWPKAASGAFNADGLAELTIHRAGPHTVRIELVATNAERHADWPEEKIWIDGVTPDRFDVGENGEALTLQVTIPAEAIDAALRRAGLR